MSTAELSWRVKATMKPLVFTTALGLALLLPLPMLAQASTIPSAAPPDASGKTQEQRGKNLIDQMIQALGGPLWLNRRTMKEEGRSAAFFHNMPNGNVVLFWSFRQFPVDGQQDLERVEYTKKRDVVHIWTRDTGYEVTYKGKTTLPDPGRSDHLRRQAHSVEAVVHTWLKQPGVIVLDEGTDMVDRRLVNKITVLGANNDAVTIDLDANSHLPRRVSFQTRNATFKDFDEDYDTFDDYHDVQGLPTAYNITHYHNGDMVNQVYLTSASYNEPISPDAFNPDVPLKKGGRKK